MDRFVVKRPRQSPPQIHKSKSTSSVSNAPTDEEQLGSATSSRPCIIPPQELRLATGEPSTTDGGVTGVTRGLRGTIAESEREGISKDPANGPECASKAAGPFQPRITHTPAPRDALSGRQPRHFKSEWYGRFPWLEYSLVKDAVFCYYCRLHAAHKPGCGEDAFTKVGVSNWKNVLDRCLKHESSKVHQTASVFHRQSSQQSTSVAKQLSSVHQQQVEKNRQYLRRIVENVLFLGKQGLAFRGHVEDAESDNRGNFLELLDLRSSDCPIIVEGLKSAVSKYTSPETQNEIIHLIAQRIQRQILQDVTSCSAFALIVDETEDISRVEQVSLCIRYCKVDKCDVTVQERFLGFLETPSTTGEALTQLLIQELSRLGLPIEKLRAQAYDGASNMSGQYQGVAARIKRIQPKAPYVHCHSHLLDLAVASACQKVTPLRNALGTVNSLYNLIEGSAKRHNVFQMVLQRCGIKTMALKSLCKTRWTQRYVAVSAVQFHLPQIFKALELISEDATSEGSVADGLMCNMNFQFLFSLICLSKILGPCHILAKELQSPNLDISSVLVKARALIAAISNLRTEDAFLESWNETTRLAETLMIEIRPQNPRPQRVPQRLGGGEKSGGADVKDQYRSNIWFTVIDIVESALSSRFSENDYSIINLLYKTVLQRDATAPDLSEISTFYGLPTEFLSEYEIFRQFPFAEEPSDIFTMASSFQRAALQSMLPQVWTLMETIICIPVSTATAERSFSSLRRLKTFLRSTMKQDRLSGLALMAIETKETKKLAAQIDVIVEDFANEGTRRLSFH